MSSPFEEAAKSAKWVHRLMDRATPAPPTERAAPSPLGASAALAMPRPQRVRQALRRERTTLAASGLSDDFEVESECPVTAFVSLHVDASARRRGGEIEARIRSLRQVVECHAVSGEFDYLLKVVTPSLAGLAEFLNGGLMLVPGIARLRSTICVAEIKTPPGGPQAATRIRRLRGLEKLTEVVR